MSLAALNHPPLIAAVGALSYLAFPFVENAFADGTLTLSAVKTASLVAYAFNVLATSRPGRIDGSDQRIGKDSSTMKLSTGSKGRTLVAPAGWAFAIWGPIFLGEFLLVASSLFLPGSDRCVATFKKVSGPFVMAQLFQILWTASFRPKYKGNYMYVSAAMLTGVAFSLSRAHACYTATPKEYSALQFVMFFLALSLHFGWTSAAALVNLNAAVVQKDDVSPKVVAVVGHISVVAAAALGAFVSLNRLAPVYGGVIAWALSAVADGMAKRIKQTEKDEDQGRVGIYGSKLQRQLCLVGAFVSGAASIAAAVLLYSK